MINMNMMTLLMATKKLGGFLVVVRFRVGCVGGFQCKAGQGGGGALWSSLHCEPCHPVISTIVLQTELYFSLKGKSCLSYTEQYCAQVKSIVVNFKYWAELTRMYNKTADVEVQVSK